MKASPNNERAVDIERPDLPHEAALGATDGR